MSETSLSLPADQAPRRGPEKRLLWRNTGFSVGQQMAAMALAVMLVPYMLWHMGAELYGLWLILQLFNILGLAYLAELGFQGAIVRYLTRFYFEEDTASFRAVLGGGLALFLAIGGVMGAGVIAFAQTALPHAFPIAPGHLAAMQWALTCIGAGLIAGFPGLVIKAYFTARQDLATTKVWELADRIIFALGVFVLLQFTTNLVALIVLEQMIAVTLLAIFTLVARRSGGASWFTLRPRFGAGGHFRGLARLSGSVFASNIASQGFNRLPELFVSVFLGPVSLTFYQIATRIPRVIKTVQGSLNAAVLPHIAGLDAADGEGEAQGHVKGGARARFAVAGLRVNYIIAVPLLVAVSLFAPVILSLWVGEEYRQLAVFMAAFAGFQGLFLASNFCAATLTQQAHFRLFVRCNLAVLGGFVAALLWGLERFGLIFLFALLLVAGAALFACVLAVFRSAHGLSLRHVVGQVVVGPILISGVLGAGLLAGPALLLSRNLWIGGSCALLLCSGLYAAALYFLVLSPEERGRLRGRINRVLRS